MRFTSIASGSSGNASYIGDEETHILIDVGVTQKAITEGLSALSLSLSDIDGIFLTHEHIDHIRAVGTISRRYGIPIYGTLATLRETLLSKSLGDFDRGLLHPILPDQSIRIASLEILPFSIDHDAADPVAYRVRSGEKCAAVTTDLGHFDDYICGHLRDLDAVLIEANHDPRMLADGPYPLPLKRRILSDKGHLSNEISGKLIDTILHPGLKHIFLGHLSEENNLPELALRTVREVIDRSESENRSEGLSISVAKRHAVSEIIEF